MAGGAKAVGSFVLAPPVVGTLDHVAVVSTNPDLLFETYERLGFRLAPFARHTGAVRPGEPTVPFGTGNRCAMFRRGYLELLAIVDRDLECRGLDIRCDRYEGLHIVAFRCVDAEAAAESLRAGGINVDGVTRLERQVPASEVPQTAAFSLIRLGTDTPAECHFNILQHHTPEIIWRSDLLDHANGAQGLEAVIICVDDPEAAARRYNRLMGATTERRGPVAWLITGSGRFGFVAPTDLPAVCYGAEAPTVPFVAGFAVSTSSLSQAEQVLVRSEMPFKRHGGALAVNACGAVCVFVDSAADASALFQN